MITNNPYKTLGIDELADDATVKQAYLQQVKLNPPDRDQERFQQIHQAYETLKDKSSRVKYALFAYPEPNFNDLLELAFESTQSVEGNVDNFKQLLSGGVNDNMWLQIISALAAQQLSKA